MDTANTPNNSSHSSSSRMASEGGRYLQRLRQLEDENQHLRTRVDQLFEWKQLMEEWVYDHFEVRLNQEPERKNETQDEEDPVGSKATTTNGATTFTPCSPRPHLSPQTNGMISNGRNSQQIEPALLLKTESQAYKTSSSDSSSLSGSPVPPKKRKTEPVSLTASTAEVEKKHKPSPSRNGLETAGGPSTSSAISMHSNKPGIGSSGNEKRPGPKSKTVTNPKKIDEEARCSVCDDKYAEENNEMLFCDKCNICVHQACYGVKTIPETEWFCKPCAKGLEEIPKCIFCPNPGGAMVPVRSPSNKQWAHVFCAMWIPEVTFQNPDDIDLVINVNRIDKYRWTMKCSICKLGKDRGACIQCQWKKCTAAFHVTCASKEKLKMEGVLDDGLPGGVALLAYCNKHRDMEG